MNCVAPPTYPARCIASLRTAESWLLCTLRLAMGRFDARFCYEQGFAAARLTEEAREQFDTATNIIKASAKRPIDIRAYYEQELSADEESFLATIRALQQGDEFTARRLMQSWVAPSGARLSLQFLGAVAEEMAAAGLRIPMPFPRAILCPALSLAARRLEEIETAADQSSWFN